MKKLVLLLAVAFSVSMFSCGNGDDKAKKDSVDSPKTETPANKPADNAGAQDLNKDVKPVQDTTAHE